MISLFILPNITRSQVKAVYEPASVPNNKFGVHIITGSLDESSPSAQLVNSSGGDWGYITVLIKSSERDTSKWQQFFNDLRRKHLIPIVRLATQAEGAYWKRPYEGEEKAWADFLNSLNWPTKNRYITVYNEVNHGQEWGNSTDPASYAEVLDKTITALKDKSPDFFILNSGFDASTPQQPPNFMDEERFMREMEKQVPGIFNRLDGWSSHSYPQPNFTGLPTDTGRGSVRTYLWELAVLKELGVNKELPVFITETGWKHAEGIDYDKSLPDSQTVGEYLSYAYRQVWSDPKVVAITPFLFNYQEKPFDHFSFKKLTGEKQNDKILGAELPIYYPQYQTVTSLPKTTGRPIQIQKAELIQGFIPHSLIGDYEYSIPFTFKNTGQSIWGDTDPVTLISDNTIPTAGVKVNRLIEPNEQYLFNFRFKTPPAGSYKIRLNLYHGNTKFDSPDHEYSFEIKQPVKLQLKSRLPLTSDYSGQYQLEARSEQGGLIELVNLDKSGLADLHEILALYPDLEYNLTIKRPYYQPKTLKKTLISGENVLDFGTLSVDWIAVITNPIGFISASP